MRETFAFMGADAVIPSNRSRKIITPHDELVYAQSQPHRALL
ncbi:hypothetical protein [Rhizobium hidalgonense]